MKRHHVAVRRPQHRPEGMESIACQQRTRQAPCRVICAQLTGWGLGAYIKMHVK